MVVAGAAALVAAVVAVWAGSHGAWALNVRRCRGSRDARASRRYQPSPFLVAVMLVAAAACSGGVEPGSEAGRGDRGGDRADAAALVATVGDQGSFSTPCGYSHSSPDDPIVHPGHSGLSHRHDFFGATTTDAGSDAASLLAGDTTCRSVADRSAYWAPSMLAGAQPVAPSGLLAYYRVPVGADAAGMQVPPNGLEMIAGDGTATEAQSAEIVRWQCGFTPEVSAVPVRCPGGMDLRLLVTFDPCWDGEGLASGDHRSHVAPLGGDGNCPPSHPVLLPQLTLEIRYALDDTTGELSLVSGPLTGGHGDALLAWDQDHIGGEVETCLRHNRNCDVISETSRLGFDQLG